MALRVWLPLNGDLHNQGTSNHKIALTDGNTWTSPGKIGNNALTLTKLQLIVPSTSCMSGAKEISYAYWIKVNTAWSANWLDGIRWIETDGSATSTARQEFYTNCTLIGTWYNGGAINGKTFTPGVWTHLAGTFNYNTGEAKFYINGVLSGSTTNVNTAYYCRGDFCIGDNGVDICENDVRIYDHCLSAAEVHEISQGLILHYKLDSMAIKSGANLVTGITKGGQTTLLTDGRLGVETSGTNADTYFTVNLSESITNGTQYYLCCDASGISPGATWNFPLGTQSNSSLPFAIHNGHNELSFTANDINWGTNRLFLDDNGRADWANKAQFYNFQLVKIGTGTETIVKDSSGYGHNGIITGNLTLNTNTPKYSSCTNFISGQKISTIGLLTNSNPIFTVNFWIKTYSNTYTQWADVISFSGNKAFRLEASNTSGKNLNWYNYPIGSTVGISNGSVNYDEWNMLTLVWNGTSIITYKNGTQVASTAITGTEWLPNGNCSIGDNGMYMYLSDVRIYCTALSADDVKTLYQVSARADNLHGFHTYEFIENSPKISVTKTGQVKCNEINEVDTIKLYKSTNNINAKEFIEI